MKDSNVQSCIPVDLLQWNSTLRTFAISATASVGSPSCATLGAWATHACRTLYNSRGRTWDLGGMVFQLGFGRHGFASDLSCMVNISTRRQASLVVFFMLYCRI